MLFITCIVSVVCIYNPVLKCDNCLRDLHDCQANHGVTYWLQQRYLNCAVHLVSSQLYICAYINATIFLLRTYVHPVCDSIHKYYSS